MKQKITSLLLTVLLLFTISACNNGNTQQIDTSISTTCSHSWQPATCTAPKTCNLCNITEGNELGHTTQTGTCTRCNINFGKWQKKYYVDEFGLPTDTPYITNKNYLVGTFSNSATSNSTLYAYFLIDKNDIAIVLLEYGSHKVKSYSKDAYKIIMLDGNNQKYYIYGTMYENGDRVYINSSDESTVINALKRSGTISFYLEESKYTLSTYLFSVETSNFSELYKTL